MESFVVLNTENNLAIGDQPKIEKATTAPFGNTPRKKLADITNLPQQNWDVVQHRKSQVMPFVTKEYVDQLQKENMALMKILADRNKLIEVTGIELHKLRINLHKMQQQNLQLVQSNSKMLADLNSSKDRLKALQHELGCHNGVLKAKNMEVHKLELQVKSREIGDDESNCEGAGAESSKIGRNDDRLGVAKRRPQSKSSGSSVEVQSKDINENKRPCARRKSARFEHEEIKPDDGLFDAEDAKFSVCQPTDDSVLNNVSTSTGDDGRGNEVENKRPCARRQSARIKSEEPKPSEDIFEIQDAKFSYKLRNATRRLLSKSLGSSLHVQSKDTNQNKRKSARFEHEELKPDDSIFDGGDAKFSVCQPTDKSLLDNVSTSVGADGHGNEVETKSIFDGEDAKFSACQPTDDSLLENVSSSMGDDGEVENKRPCARRQSSRFKSGEPKLSEDLFGIQDAKFSYRLRNAKRRPQSKSLGSSLQVQSKDTNKNKRPCTRRKSARFEHEELKSDDSLFDGEDAKFFVCQPTDDSLLENVSTSMGNDGHGNEVENERPCSKRQSASENFFKIQDATLSSHSLRDDKVQEDGLTSTGSLKNEEKGISSPVYGTQGSRRSSLNRPSRQAAKKVQTYKEVPVNIKMRRTSESKLWCSNL
ncbi:hypothetical protein ACH5RR_018924 [Cinchona calisaya]|uniref:Shugoshin C-terminal domain-containing protein n=1 Tax=Cinchona calisaya TaxID=153742 RepID=A0ABD2ZMU9_9GENT